MGGQYYHEMKCDGKSELLESGCIDCIFRRQIPIYLFSKFMTSTFDNFLWNEVTKFTLTVNQQLSG